MKKIVIGLITLLSLSSQASLLGSIEGQNSYVFLDILDFQPSNQISLELQADGDSESKYRNISTYLPVQDYYLLFNTGENFSVKTPELEYSAFGPKSNRTIIITSLTLDDSQQVAQKEVATLKIKNEKAELTVQAYRKKRVLFYVGELKLVETTTVSNLTVNRDGVELFVDNRGWPLGKVVTQEGLYEASANTSTNALRDSCEAHCVD